jgi:PAS domain S-box-containing protein
MKIPSNLFAQIVEKSLDGIWLVDINNQTAYVNQITAEMLGYEPSELMTKNFSDLMNKDDWTLFSEKLNSRKKGVSEHHELRFFRKDSSPVWVRAACNPLYNDNDEYVGAVGLLSDITEIRKDEIILQAQRNVFEKLITGSSLKEGLLELLKPIDQVVIDVHPSILLLDDENRLWEGASLKLSEAYEKEIS